jgi:hypothetical protein
MMVSTPKKLQRLLWRCCCEPTAQVLLYSYTRFLAFISSWPGALLSHSTFFHSRHKSAPSDHQITIHRKHQAQSIIYRYRGTLVSTVSNERCGVCASSCTFLYKYTAQDTLYVLGFHKDVFGSKGFSADPSASVPWLTGGSPCAFLSSARTLAVCKESGRVRARQKRDHAQAKTRKLTSHALHASRYFFMLTHTHIFMTWRVCVVSRMMMVHKRIK